MMIPVIWLIFRSLTSLFIALTSVIKPLTSIEKAIPLIPPSQPLQIWLERAVLSPWFRWDAVWYQQIVESGYRSSDGTAQFHPLFPWLANIFFTLGLHPLASLLLVSSLASFGFLFVYYKLARMELSESDAIFSVMLMLLAPAAFVLFAPYSESLFLLCAAGCFYYCRKMQWWLAGILGGLAVLTRQQGLLLVFPMAWELWEATVKYRWQVKARLNNWFSLILLPLSYLFWSMYRMFILNDIKPQWDNFHNLVYSLLITPSANEVVPEQRFIWPWNALLASIKKLIFTPDLDIWVNLIAAGLFLVFLCVSWGYMRRSYQLFALIITLVSFSYYTGVIHPYMGLPRHLLLAFPVFITTATKLNHKVYRPLTIGFLSVGYLFMIMLYSFETWVL